VQYNYCAAAYDYGRNQAFALIDFMSDIASIYQQTPETTM